MKYLYAIILVILFSLDLSAQEYYIETSIGDIEIEVYSDKAPVSVANFKAYVKQKKFDGAEFFRVVRMDNQPNDSIRIEVVQGVFTGSENALPPIAHETTDMTGIKHADGVLSMARLEPGTAAQHFFICVGDQPALDYGGMRNPDGQGFATFGRVTKGMDIVRQIQAGATEGQTLIDRIDIVGIYERD